GNAEFYGLTLNCNGTRAIWPGFWRAAPDEEQQPMVSLPFRWTATSTQPPRARPQAAPKSCCSTYWFPAGTPLVLCSTPAHCARTRWHQSVDDRVLVIASGAFAPPAADFAPGI